MYNAMHCWRRADEDLSNPFMTTGQVEDRCGGVMPRSCAPAGCRLPAGLRFLTVLCLIPSLLTSCERPIPPEELTTAAVAEDELDVLWDCALAVLSRYDFRPDRQDRAMGVIETKPSTSKQWGEWWRRDVGDPYSLGESSLHTVQRQATVRFVRGAEGRRIEVQVDVYRLSVPESQITTASSAIHSFDGALPTSEGGYGKDVDARKRWVPLGRDSEVENRLLASILARAGMVE